MRGECSIDDMGWSSDCQSLGSSGKQVNESYVWVLKATVC